MTPLCNRYRRGAPCVGEVLWWRLRWKQGVEGTMQEEQGVGCSGATAGCVALAPAALLKRSRPHLRPGLRALALPLPPPPGRARRPLPHPPGQAGDGPRGADPAIASLSGSAGGHPTPPFPGMSGPRGAPGGGWRSARRGSGAAGRGASPPYQRGAGASGRAATGRRFWD